MITKSVFLIMYLWHTAGSSQSSIGGPAITVAQMPSLTVCEKVGAEAKAFADQRAIPKNYWAGNHATRPAEFRCIEVDDAAPQPLQVKCSTK